MSKQPYIPLYTGDYMQDTRALPLNVRGAWVEIMIHMWRSEQRGVVTGTMPEFAMMMGCLLEEANFAIGLLQQKKICDFEILPNGMVKLICRRMYREAKTAELRSEAGKAGAEAKRAKAIAKAKEEAKQKQNTDIDNDSDNDTEFKIQYESLETKIDQLEEKIDSALDELYINKQRVKWSHINFDFELNSFREKVRGSPTDYITRDTDGIRLAFQYQLRNAKSKPNGTNQTTGKKQQHTANLAASVAKTYSRVFTGGANGQGSGTPPEQN